MRIERQIRLLLLTSVVILSACVKSNNSDIEIPKPIQQRQISSISTSFLGLSIEINLGYNSDNLLSRVTLDSPYMKLDLNYRYSSGRIECTLLSSNAQGAQNIDAIYHLDSQGRIETLDIVYPSSTAQILYHYNSNNQLQSVEMPTKTLNLSWDGDNCLSASVVGEDESQIIYGNDINRNSLNILTMLASDYAFYSLVMDGAEVLSSFNTSLLGKPLHYNLPIETIEYIDGTELDRTTYSYTFDSDGYIESATIDGLTYSVTYL